MHVPPSRAERGDEQGKKRSPADKQEVLVSHPLLPTLKCLAGSCKEERTRVMNTPDYTSHPTRPNQIVVRACVVNCVNKIEHREVQSFGRIQHRSV